MGKIGDFVEYIGLCGIGLGIRDRVVYMEESGLYGREWAVLYNLGYVE